MHIISNSNEHHNPLICVLERAPSVVAPLTPASSCPSSSSSLLSPRSLDSDTLTPIPGYFHTNAGRGQYTEVPQDPSSEAEGAALRRQVLLAQAIHAPNEGPTQREEDSASSISIPSLSWSQYSTGGLQQPTNHGQANQSHMSGWFSSGGHPVPAPSAWSASMGSIPRPPPPLSPSPFGPRSPQGSLLHMPPAPTVPESPGLFDFHTPREEQFDLACAMYNTPRPPSTVLDVVVNEVDENRAASPQDSPATELISLPSPTVSLPPSSRSPSPFSMAPGTPGVACELFRGPSPDRSERSSRGRSQTRSPSTTRSPSRGSRSRGRSPASYRGSLVRSRSSSRSTRSHLPAAAPVYYYRPSPVRTSDVARSRSRSRSLRHISPSGHRHSRSRSRTPPIRIRPPRSPSPRVHRRHSPSPSRSPRGHHHFRANWRSPRASRPINNELPPAVRFTLWSVRPTL
ncbi:hypothetical protein FB45DRAFT_29501 [Roridomyces roridus]|uniref:Uncharacterized protein n=1 Tax=Roridomyces roridus TaxID=1738132 RepID=A0AAD7CKW6_9AGAR|nr:hypothetical protein FB45DRAFT_29501 [Roridomyces roridus]